jgi:uncharacterized repeat protein (TIGR03803 family)
MRRAGIVTMIIVFGLVALAAAVNEQVLYPFELSSGIYPNALLSDSAGNLYGMTNGGGSIGGGYGVVFELSSSGATWTETVLHYFSGNDGAAPIGGLIHDSAGNLYGVTSAGGSGCSFDGCGVVFELSPMSAGWTETVLYRFTGGSDGERPLGTLVMDQGGNLYGTTQFGGNTSQCDCGTVFQLAHTANGWKFNVLYSFTGGADGAEPLAGLLISSGSLYGTASGGGNPSCTGLSLPGCGTAFSLTPAGHGVWQFQVVYSFGSGTDGAYPLSSLIADSSRNLYGTTLSGGSVGDGTVFRLTAGSGGQWQETILHSFIGSDGEGPSAPLVFDKLGNLYGTTQYGGGKGSTYGTAFRLTPGSNGNWHETVLHVFTGGLDGQTPTSGLIIGRGPGLYGSTSAGSQFSGGIVYEITR